MTHRLTYRITHIDHHQRRRQLVLQCECRAAAETLAVLMYGTPAFLSTICLHRRGPAA